MSSPGGEPARKKQNASSNQSAASMQAEIAALKAALLFKANQKSIFTDGLPELGPLSDTSKFTSSPSVPTEEQHASAKLKISSFSTLPDLEELPYPKTNIWNQVIDETGTLGGYSNEAGVNSQVERVIIDILEALGVRAKVTIRAEVEVMRNRPDFMLILVNGHPIGTIEGKQPGQRAMDHPNILGEVYDQLMHLYSIFRVTTPFAILTCYEEWRICWLNHEDSNNLAGRDTLPATNPFQTPPKPSRQKMVEMKLVDKPPSLPPPPTPSRAKGALSLQLADGESDEEATFDSADSMDRSLCGTDIIKWNSKTLPMMLASVIKKMMSARQLAEPTVLRLANETTSAWKKAPPFDSLKFYLCISRSVRNFFLWEDLGHGADGRAFLVSGGTKGAVGVLKFFYSDAEAKAQHEEKMWLEVYSNLPPVASTVRIVKVMGQTALLMPWFQSPNRTQSELKAVEETLRDDYMAKGICHGDVAWRNVGIYHGDDGTKAVLFDMQNVHRVTSQEDWVTSAVVSLSQKLIHD